MIKDIEIFTTTDLHGEFESFIQSETVKKLKTEDTNSIWIDNGDFFIGNPLTTYYNTQFETSPLVQKANEFGFDVMIPGNHDFDYGLDFLKKQIEKLTIPYVCCNIVDSQGKNIFEPYAIVNRKQKKIAVIGLMTAALPQLTAFNNTKDIVCKDTISSLDQTLKSLPEDIDLVVVAYHGGLEVDLLSGKSLHYKNIENQAYEIVEQFSEIDGFIAGHQHFVNAGKINKSAFVQPGSHGKAIGKLTFTPTPNGWTNTAKILPVDYSVKFENKDFNFWLEEELDTACINKFLSYYFEISEDFIWFQINGNRRKDFLNAFSIPFSFYKYTFLKNEWEKINPNHKNNSINNDSITIYTNKADLPKYRLMTTYIDNIFDLYHHYLLN